MANYQHTSDIIADALFRSDEPTDGSSDYEDRATVYINRAYRALWLGGSEFDPDINENWWWLKAESSIILHPAANGGTINVENNTTTFSLSSGNNLASTLSGAFLKVDDHADVFRVATWIASTSGGLDTVYTGGTATAANYKIFVMDYTLSTGIYKLISPMKAYQDGDREIDLISNRDMQKNYPLNNIEQGVPTRFSVVGEDPFVLRFNRYGGQTASQLIRVDFDHLFIPSDLTTGASEEPVIPIQWRHVLADLTAYFILLDKDNNKATTVGNAAQQGLKAMAKENKRRWSTQGEIGRIHPRAGDTAHADGPLRTESGVILG